MHSFFYDDNSNYRRTLNSCRISLEFCFAGAHVQLALNKCLLNGWNGWLAGNRRLAGGPCLLPSTLGWPHLWHPGDSISDAQVSPAQGVLGPPSHASHCPLPLASCLGFESHWLAPPRVDPGVRLVALWEIHPWAPLPRLELAQTHV